MDSDPEYKLQVSSLSATMSAICLGTTSAMDVVSNNKNKISVQVEVVGGENGVVTLWKCGKSRKSVERKKEFIPP